jgi:hypothetical protein
MVSVDLAADVDSGQRCMEKDLIEKQKAFFPRRSSDVGSQTQNALSPILVRVSGKSISMSEVTPWKSDASIERSPRGRPTPQSKGQSLKQKMGMGVAPKEIREAGRTILRKEVLHTAQSTISRMLEGTTNVSFRRPSVYLISFVWGLIPLAL